jgi:chromosome segregation ATPase
MKWIGIGVVLAVLLGGLGFVAVKTGWFASAKEDANAWMDEQQLKNFPALAREELRAMEGRLATTKKQQKDLNTKVNYYAGSDNMSESSLTDESNGYATVKGYDILKKKADDKIASCEAAINKLVGEVKAAQADYIKANPTITESGAIPADVTYEVTKSNGGKTKITLADAKKITADIAKDIDKAKKEKDRFEKRQARLTELVAKLKTTSSSLDKAIEVQAEKIDDMKVMITDMEAELKLLEIEKDIASINAAIEGKESDSKFGKLIANFKDNKRKWEAEQSTVEKTGGEAGKGVSSSDFTGTDSGTPATTSADSYWK